MRKFKDNQEKENGLVFRPLQVEVTGSFEDAVRRFKSLVQKEKVISRYKEKQAYEKPSDKARRKIRESRERQFILKQREALMQSGEWDKIYQKKQQKKQEKIQQRMSDRNAEKKPSE